MGAELVSVRDLSRKNGDRFGGDFPQGKVEQKLAFSAQDQPSTEIITAEQLAARLQVPASWVYNRTRSCTASSQRIPHLKIGRYTRFAWGSPELTQWLRSLETR